jgi:hypothetical protein
MTIHILTLKHESFSELIIDRIEDEDEIPKKVVEAQLKYGENLVSLYKEVKLKKYDLRA